jgi:WD40 repeat protein
MSEATTGQAVREFAGAAGAPQAIASRVDNQRVAVGTADGKLFVWNAANAELLQTLAVDGPVRAIAWTPDNLKLAASTETNKLFIFGPPLPPQPSQPGSELVMHQQTVTESPATRIAFDRENRTVWASHASGHLGQWSYAAPTQIRQFNHGGPVYGVTTSRDGKTIVSCSADQTVRVWDTATGQQRFQMNGHVGAVHAVALSPDESFAVSSGADRTLRLWDIVGGRQLKQLATLDETMYSVVVHPNGQLVAAAGADRKVYLFDLISGAIARTLTGHTDFIHCVAFNSAGTRLLSYGYAGQLRIWEPSAGQLLLEQQIGRIGNYANYNADGSRVLLSNGDGTARLFEIPLAAK